MKIIRAEIIGFGKFNNKVYTFKNGLNLIYGENEKGKSTLHKFIEGVLFGFYKPYTKNKQYTVDYENYIPWEGENYSGSVEFSVDDKIYRAYRNFTKLKEEFKLFDAITGEDITKTLPYDSTIKQHSIAELIKMNSVLYNNTASIGQLKAKTENSFKKEISETLSNYEKGADSSVSLNKAIESLEKQKRQIGTRRQLKSPLGSSVLSLESLIAKKEKIIKTEEENKNNYILVRELEDEIQTLQKEKRILETKINDIAFNDEKEKYLKYKSVEKENAELEEKLIYLDKYKDINSDAYKDFIDLENKISNLNDDLNQLKNELEMQNIAKDELKEEVDRIREDLGGKNFNQLKSDIDILEDRMSTIEKLKGVLGNQKNDDLESNYNRKDSANKIISILLILGVIATLFLVFFTFKIDDSFLVYAYISGGATIALVIVKLVAYSMWKSKSSEYEKYDTNILKTKNMIELNEVDINKLFEEYKKSDMKELRFDLENKCQIAENFDEKKNEYDRILFQLDEAVEKEKRLNEHKENYKKELEKLLREKNIENTDEFKNAFEARQKYELLLSKKKDNERLMNNILAQDEISFMEKKFSDNAENEMDSNESEILDKKELQNTIDKLSTKISEKREEFSRISGIIEKTTEESDDLSNIEEDINKCKSKIDEYEFKLSVAEKAIYTMSGVSKAIHASVAPSLNETIGDIIKLVTGGKYSRINVDNNMDIKVLDESSGKMIEAEKLSSGTIDQIYMALRMSITKNLLANDDIPILLDETFIQYDDQRLERMLEYVSNMASDRQVLMFTCHNREENVLKGKNISYDKIIL